MNKIGRIFWKVILMLVFMPLVKTFYDIFTAPTTGLFVVAGMDDNTLAIMTAIPWVFPLIVFIMLVRDITKPDEEPTQNIGGIKFPRIK